MTAQIRILKTQFLDYVSRFPSQEQVALDFLELLDEGTVAFGRERLHGHFTASCWLVNAAGDQVLLTHHRKLQRWLQLGGHADGEQDLALAALREAQEESGLSNLHVIDRIFDLDRHTIPARAEEPEHDHFDVRYVIVANGSEDPVVSEESLDIAWRDIRELADDPDSDASMRRMARQWLTSPRDR